MVTMNNAISDIIFVLMRLPKSFAPKYYQLLPFKSFNMVIMRNVL